MGNSTTIEYNEYSQKELVVDKRGSGIEYIDNDELLVMETVDKLENSSYQDYKVKITFHNQNIVERSDKIRKCIE